jgi:hypothetical protein
MGKYNLSPEFIRRVDWSKIDQYINDVIESEIKVLNYTTSTNDLKTSKSHLYHMILKKAAEDLVFTDEFRSLPDKPWDWTIKHVGNLKVFFKDKYSNLIRRKVKKAVDVRHKYLDDYYWGRTTDIREQSEEESTSKIDLQKKITEYFKKHGIKLGLSTIGSLNTLKKIFNDDSIGLKFLKYDFDLIFNKLKLKLKYENSVLYYGEWINQNKELIFSRNNWGTVWVNDCDIYLKLIESSKSLGLDSDTFESLLVNYLNEKSGDKFKNDNPIKSIDDDGMCSDYNHY